MSRSGGRRAGVLAAGALAAAVAAAPLPAAAQTPEAPPSPPARIELTPPVQRTLLELQEQWVLWISAFYQHREKTVEALVSRLLTTARRLGMGQLPDLALAALAPAVEAAREGDFERARWAIEGAEVLDPGRPETAFAAARVAAAERSYLRAAGQYVLAYARLFRHPWLRTVWMHHVLLWTWSALVATGVLCLAMLMATRGRRLVDDLTALFAQRLPRALAVPLALVLLAAPAALPPVAVWLVLVWTVLLWAYVSASERVVLAALLVLVAAAPLLLAEQARRVAVAASPPMRAVVSLAHGRLYGDLFRDLEALRAALPQSAAALQLVADLHRRLGQWDLASQHYREVLKREGQNTAVFLDLGAYHFAKGDFGRAIEHFQQAAAADSESAAAQFNLSQAYSESYLFDEQRRALEQARAIDGDLVASWVAAEQRVVTVDGGLERIPEIRRQLLAVHRARATEPKGSGPVGRALGLLMPVAAIVAGVALRRRRGGPEEVAGGEAPLRAGRSRWLRAFLPGLAAAETGEGGRSFLALLVPVALLLLPLGGRIGYRVPWGYDPGNLVPWIVAVAGLVVYLGARLTWELRHRV
jgi:tetratricopeptide (TPR) repeat protein